MARDFGGSTHKVDYGTSVAKAASNISGYCLMRSDVDKTANRDHVMFTVGPQGGSNNTNFVFLLGPYSPAQNTVTFAVRPSSTWFEISTTTLTWTKEVWTHLGFTYDGSSVRFFKNGVFIESVSASHTLVTTGTQNFRIGGRLDSADDFFDGRLAMIGYHTALLTDGEMMHAYANGFVFGRSCQILAPLGWASTEPEYSGNKHSGTVTSATVANAPPYRNPFAWYEEDPYVVSAGGGGANPKGPIHGIMLHGPLRRVVGA